VSAHELEKRHYTAFAKMLAELYPGAKIGMLSAEKAGRLRMHRAITHALSAYFNDRPKFDPERFEKAATGGHGWPIP
jgi:hypothetical protein